MTFSRTVYADTIPPMVTPKPKPLTLLAGVTVVGVLAGAGWVYRKADLFRPDRQ